MLSLSPASSLHRHARAKVQERLGCLHKHETISCCCCCCCCCRCCCCCYCCCCRGIAEKESFVGPVAAAAGAGRRRWNERPRRRRRLTWRYHGYYGRYEETSKMSGLCEEQESKETSQCYGGFARLATLIRQARNTSTEDSPTFFLNAGNNFQGSKLFLYHKENIVARFLNILKPDAVSLGNHEFDEGVGALVRFVEKINFPVVAANLNLTSEPVALPLQNSANLKKSTILLAKNRKIGVIGYVTQATVQLSIPGNIIFLDEVSSVRDEAKKLKSEGCEIIIALGSSGFDVDKKIAREVEDVDLVIGGHTHTFLYNGPKPDLEEPESPYPTVVEQPSGRKVYVVQAYAYTKYLGDLSIDFDSKGEITRIEGNPILVNSSIPKAEDVERELVEMNRQMWQSVVDSLFFGIKPYY